MLVKIAPMGQRNCLGSVLPERPAQWGSWPDLGGPRASNHSDAECRVPNPSPPRLERFGADAGNPNWVDCRTNQEGSVM